MANYSIAKDQVSTPLITLAAGVEDSVTFAAEFVPQPKVIIHSASSAVWVTSDGRTANPSSGYARPLLAGMEGRLDGENKIGNVVKLYSSGTATYSVER